MSFIQSYGGLKEIKSSKKKDAKDLLSISIEKQRRLVNGEKVVGAKKDTVIRSWFKNGLFAPSIGINKLFGNLAIECKSGSESKMLDDFEKAFKAGEFDKEITAIQTKKSKSKIK
jgi:hypothetical protein